MKAVILAIVRFFDKTAYRCVQCKCIARGAGARIGNGWACSNKCYKEYWTIEDPCERQRCYKCRKWFNLSDGGFLEELSADGKPIFVCENCEPNMAPREDEKTNRIEV